MYKQAQELKTSLDEADIAQQKAKDAIAQANEDISLARADLEKVNLNVHILSFSFIFGLDYDSKIDKES